MPTRVTVTVPPGTPEWEPLFLAGPGPGLGDWSPHHCPLSRRPDGTFETTVEAEAGTPVVVTRGTWRTVESDGRGRECPPHVLTDESCVIAVRGWGRGAHHYHHHVASEYLEHDRTVGVHLPPGYDGVRRFPVLYLHDGQNLFDDATSFAGCAWHCDEAAETAARRGRARPVILVGVANSPDRIAEYAPRRDGADATAGYAKFLVHELKSFIDRHYVTRPEPTETGVVGSSLGGLISLHLAKRHPEAFGLCGAISPSLWWDHDYFLDTIGEDAGWLKSVRLWLDMGHREGATRVTQLAGVRRARKLARKVEQLGLTPPGAFCHREYPEGEHNEWHWGRRFGEIVEFLFPPDDKT